MNASLLNFLAVGVALAWTALLVGRFRRDARTGATAWLLGTLAVVAALRLPYLSAVEPNPDASTWLAVALTVRQHPDPLLTLLTHADARPLTVLPLVLAQALGVPFGYAGAEVVGLLCWLGTLGGAYRLLRFRFSETESLFGTWALGLFVGTTGYPDHVGYNSEHLAVLMLTLGTVGVLALGRAGRVPPGKAALLGLLLGFLPYEKFQAVPMGLVLAAFAAWALARRRAWAALGALGAGGVLPTALVVGAMAGSGHHASFVDTYLGHYVSYSFTQEFSRLPAAARFSPGRAARFVFGNRQAVLYLAGQALALGAGLVLRHRRPGFGGDFFGKNLLLSGLLLLVSTYAVLQAGNDFTHYTLLLFVPLLHAVAVVLWGLAPTARRALGAVVLLTALGQGTFNAAARRPAPPLATAEADQQLAALIDANSRPGDPLVVWGYADRLHVLARRPMGYRFANSFYVHAAYRGFYEKNLNYFLQDVRESRPAVFVDAMVPGLSLHGDARQRHEAFPAVAAWVRAHYRRVGEIHGARVYRRTAD